MSVRVSWDSGSCGVERSRRAVSWTRGVCILIVLLLLVRLLDLLLLQHLIPIQMQVTHSFLELVQLLFA